MSNAPPFTSVSLSLSLSASIFLSTYRSTYLSIDLSVYLCFYLSVKAETVKDTLGEPLADVPRAFVEDIVVLFRAVKEEPGPLYRSSDERLGLSVLPQRNGKDRKCSR